MKRTAFNFFLLVFCASSNGQVHPAVYDIKSKYYSKTDFAKVDTINLWAFKIDTLLKHERYKDSNSIAKITFYRTKLLLDSRKLVKKKNYYEQYPFWIDFEIFNIRDSIYCFNLSERLRKGSCCPPPFTGGDILFVGNFILLNNQSSNNYLLRFSDYSDYCRPIVNKVFSDVDLSKVTTLQSFINLLPIKGKFE